MLIPAILMWHRTDLQFTCKIILSTFFKKLFFHCIFAGKLSRQSWHNKTNFKSISLSRAHKFLSFWVYLIKVILAINIFFNIVVSLFPSLLKLYFVICFLLAFMYLFIWKCVTRKPPHNVSCISHIVPLMLLKLLTSSK